MYLPISSSETPELAKGLIILVGDGKGELPKGWSSLIGIVSAIVGNILISFALNTQRYAHLRLSRDQEQARQQARKAARRSGTPSYGTNGVNGNANGTANGLKDNVKAEPGDGHRQDEPTETQPLIPKQDSRRTSYSSLGSGATDEKDTEVKEKSYLQSPIWWVGIILMAIGETGNFLAYGFAPASIVSPLGVVALISNCLIAPLLLGEKFRWRDALGVLIAVGGCVVVVLSASDSNPKLTPDAIWTLVTQWEFETYLGVTCTLIVVLMVASNKIGEKTILIDIGLVGLFGGYTALSTKGVASLLTYSIWRVVTFPITYLLVAVLVVTAVMQIKYINRALQRFNATMVIPTQFVCFTISVIVGSAVLYRDFERQTPADGIKFGCGCALTFFGVWCITSGRKKDSDSVDGDDETEDGLSIADEERTMPEIREQDEGDAITRNSNGYGSPIGGPSLQRASTADIGSLPKLVAIASTPPRSPVGVESQPLIDEVHQLQPGAASAVHTDSAAPLNLGEGSRDPSKRPPLHATTSAPIPPSPHPSTSLRPKTPLTRSPSGPPTDAPSRTSPSRQHLDPHSAPRLKSRPSLVGIFPSALTSPLSGSLSAIVADELRRGTDRSPLGVVQRRKSAKNVGQQRRPTIESGTIKPVLSRTKSGSGKRHSIASGAEGDFDRENAIDGRTRSLSATLTDMFGMGSGSLKRQRTLESQAQSSRQPHLGPAFDESSARK
jgi:drug/metabolite transporter (DMT)-like permease